MGFLSLPDWANLGIGAAFLILLFTGLYRGWVWTKTSVDRLEAQYKLAMADKDTQIREWREAYQSADARNDKLAEYLREMVDVAKTSNAALSALPRPPLRERST